ncbi:MAG: hypothetical protein AVDCRST_MAG40-1, partial [uncultured Gemmatimonadaceae bacterium]
EMAGEQGGGRPRRRGGPWGAGGDRGRGGDEGRLGRCRAGAPAAGADRVADAAGRRRARPTGRHPALRRAARRGVGGAVHRRDGDVGRALRRRAVARAPARGGPRAAARGAGLRGELHARGGAAEGRDRAGVRRPDAAAEGAADRRARGVRAHHGGSVRGHDL